ncbi:MAG: SDR family oxidoreductase [Polyangiaceae bacterium]
MRAEFREKYGPWAIVTGASSGIGDELARQLAAVKMNVVLVARRRERLETLSAELTKAHGVETRIVELDLGRLDACDTLVAATKGLEIGLLVNNAGFGMKGEFVTLDRAEQTRMIAVNCRAPLELTHAFLPSMIARKRGGVIVVASSAAFQALPITAAYSATKAFETLFAEGLGEEMRPHGVDVLALCPGPTDTEGPRRTGVDPDKVPVKMMHPRDVAKAGLDALGRKAIEIPGFTNRLIYFLVKFLPRAFVTRMAGKLIRRVST